MFLPALVSYALSQTRDVATRPERPPSVGTPVLAWPRDDAWREYGVQDHGRGGVSHSSNVVEVKLLQAAYHHLCRCNANHVRRFLTWLRTDEMPSIRLIVQQGSVSTSYFCLLLLSWS